MKLLILGGDKRVSYMAEKLMESGFSVYSYIQSAPACGEAALRQVFSEADAFVGGLPFSRDGKTVFAPFFDTPLPIDTLLPCLRAGMPMLLGKPGKALSKKLTESGAIVHDYFAREEVSLLNAVPTAEGAIEIALSHLPVTLWETECLVAGFGRIGQYLARLLSFMGARVTVSARKASDFAKCRMLGYRTLHTAALAEAPRPFRVVFNTIPHCVFSRAVLSSLRPDCLLVDLASAPGGFDTGAAAEMGRTLLPALSLPGKVAPETAGEFLADAVQSILRERN